MRKLLLILLFPLCCFSQSRPLVGAIRWDAWYGVYPYPGDIINAGIQVERALGPHKYHYRAPWYSKEITRDSIQCRLTNQNQMDQDIAYAKYAGIDYFAICYYDTQVGLDIGRKLYLASQYNADVKWCLILGTDYFDFKKNTNWLIDRFKEPIYQKVLDGRPIIYLYQFLTPLQISTLRAATIARGVKNPYIIQMMSSYSDAFAVVTKYGVDAISRYNSNAGSNGTAYYPQIPNMDIFGWNAYKYARVQVVPWVTTGRNAKPRIDHQVAWTTVSATGWTADATPIQIANHVQEALTFVQSNKSTCKANTVLIYAWNEYDEGGWIAPTFGLDSTRLKAIKTILNP